MQETAATLRWVATLPQYGMSTMRLIVLKPQYDVLICLHSHIDGKWTVI